LTFLVPLPNFRLNIRCHRENNPGVRSHKVICRRVCRGPQAAWGSKGQPCQADGCSRIGSVYEVKINMVQDNGMITELMYSGTLYATGLCE